MARFKTTNRVLSLVLAFALVLTLLPGVAFGAFAEDAAETAYSASQKDSSVMSLTVDGTAYYFDSVMDAFKETALVKGKVVTYKLLKDVNEEFSHNDNNLYVLAGVKEATIDLNGHSLALNATLLKDGAADASGYVNLMIANGADKLTMCDSAYTSGAQKAVKLNNSSPALSASNNVVTNVEIDISGTTTLGLYTQGTSFEMTNSKVVYNAAGTNAVVCTAKESNISNCIIVNENAKGTALELENRNTKVTLNNNDVTSGDNAIYCFSGPNVTIDGGTYKLTDANGALFMYYSRGNIITIKNGTFTGPVGKFSGTSYLRIESALFTNADVVLNDNITADHSTRTSENSGTRFVAWTPVAASVSVTDPDYAAVETSTGDIAVAYKDHEAIYTVTCAADYTVTDVKLNGSSVEKSAFTVDGLKTTYKLTPTADFTVSFVISKTKGESDPDTVQLVSKDGKTANYKSLTYALAASQDGDTFKLLEDIVWPETINVNKNMTLDLNGHGLTFTIDNNTANAIMVNKAVAFTVDDSTADKAGYISFGGKCNGIKIAQAASGASVIVNAGTLKDPVINAIEDTFYGGTAYDIFINGGKVLGKVYLSSVGNGNLTISGGTIAPANSVDCAVYFSSTGTIKMTGGEIEASSTANGHTAIMAQRGTLVLTGGKITGSGASNAVSMVGFSNKSSLTLGGTAELISENGYALYTNLGTLNRENQAEISIEDSAKLNGAKNAVFVEEVSTANIKHKSFTVNGGAFKSGEGYLPISDTSFVTYPEGKVLDTVADSEGYYKLADKFDARVNEEATRLTGKEVTYSYHDLEGNAPGGGLGGGLNQLLEKAAAYEEKDAEGNLNYTNDLWNSFTSAYSMAQRVAANMNANQTEIDYRAAALSSAMASLDSYVNRDLTKLAKGTYTIGISAMKIDRSGASMASGAFDDTATLKVSDEGATLTITMHPVNVMSTWGHLRRLYYYDDTVADNFTQTLKDRVHEALSYGDWYTGNETMTKADAPAKLSGRTADEYPPYPGSATIPVTKFDTSLDGSTLYIGVNVDAMDSSNMEGITNLLLVLAWGSVKEVEVQPTMYVDDAEMALLQGQTGETAVTLVEADGYQLSSAVKSSSSDVATAEIKDGKVVVTPKGVGTTTLTVTASKDGASDLTKTIAVTVAAEGAKEIGVASRTVEDNAAVTTLSGSFVPTKTGDSAISVTSSGVTIDATGDEEGITAASVVIPAETGKALADMGKPVTISTDAGSAVIAAADLANGTTIGIKKTDLPKDAKAKNGSKVNFTASSDVAYEITGIPGTATVTVPYTGRSGYAYTVAKNRLVASSKLMANKDTASFAAGNGTYVLTIYEYELADPAPTFNFVDVPSDIYYHDPVYWAADNEITNGTDATHFSPDLICTRAQLVTFLWRYAGSPEPTTTKTPFTDVDVNSWYGKAVLWATEKGIVKGMTPTTFEPFTNVNRAQTITMIYRYEGSPAVEKSSTFTDVPSDIYYADAVAWGVANKIVQGMTPTTFEPNTECARAQAVTFLYRLANA